MKIKDRKIIIVNQAVNYLTIGICNEFAVKFENVTLLTGGVHTQGEALDPTIEVKKLNKWKEEHGFSKAIIYLRALLKIWFLLLTKYRRYEVLFISVPPMAYLLNIVLPNRSSMLIWDVYPDVFKITGMKESHWVYRIWSKLNRISFNKAYRLFTIGDKMAELISTYVPREKLIVQPIWSIFQSNNKASKENNPFIKTYELSDKFIVQYSGNIGLTHKVEVMIDLAEKMQEHTNILFQIIGRGPRVSTLKKMVNEKQLPNCQFLPFQSDEMFPFSLAAADIGIVILDELTSKGSVPSKSYNLMSYGIPSLYIAAADSELQNYVKRFQHAACYTESELDDAANFILNLYNDKDTYTKLANNSTKAASHFKRNNATKFVEFYLS